MLSSVSPACAWTRCQAVEGDGFAWHYCVLLLCPRRSCDCCVRNVYSHSPPVAPLLCVRDIYIYIYICVCRGLAPTIVIGHRAGFFTNFFFLSFFLSSFLSFLFPSFPLLSWVGGRECDHNSQKPKPPKKKKSRQPSETWCAFRLSCASLSTVARCRVWGFSNPIGLESVQSLHSTHSLTHSLPLIKSRFVRSDGLDSISSIPSPFAQKKCPRKLRRILNRMLAAVGGLT